MTVDDAIEDGASPDDRFRPGTVMVTGVHAWQSLGRGKWCESWIGWSMVHGHPVTVKLAQSGEVAGEARAVLRREARRLATIQHPAYQRLLGGDLDAEEPFLVLEYIDGPTLGYLLANDGAFGLADALVVLAELAAATSYLHRLGYAHLDLKPNNVVLRDGRVALLDLGLSTRMGRPVTSPRGTKGYVAPEQWSGHAVAPTSDVFSLGAILYELLAGRAPFAEDGPPEIEPDLSACGELTPETRSLLSRLIALDPAQRPAGPLDVVREVGQLLPPEYRGWPAALHAHLDWTAGGLPAWVGAGPGVRNGSEPSAAPPGASRSVEMLMTP